MCSLLPCGIVTNAPKQLSFQSQKLSDLRVEIALVLTKDEKGNTAKINTDRDFNGEKTSAGDDGRTILGFASGGDAAPGGNHVVTDGRRSTETLQPALTGGKAAPCYRRRACNPSGDAKAEPSGNAALGTNCIWDKGDRRQRCAGIGSALP